MPNHYDLSTTLDEVRQHLYTADRLPPKVCGLHTIEIYSADELFPYLGKGMQTLPVFYRGHIVEVKTTSHRLACLKRSPICVRCGKVGTIFLLQTARITHNRWTKFPPTHIHKPHFNLYHVDDAGHFHLMTQDHILPRSKGGPDTLANLQTMCSDCNNQKGADLERPVMEIC